MQFSIDVIELKDFMRFSHKVFRFSKNITLVVGRNGSGKSSILEALALSFQVKERGNAVSNYIRKGKEKAEVNLTCTWEGKPLLIKSTFSAKGRKIKRLVEYNGEVYEDTVANNFLATYFLDRQMSIAFALQGAEKFLSPSKTQNLKNIISILQIDFVKELEYIKVKLRAFAQEKDALNASINQLKGSLLAYENGKKENENVLNQYEELLKNKKEVSLANDIEDKILQIRKSMDSINSQKATYLQYKNRIVALQNSLKVDEDQVRTKKEALEKTKALVVDLEDIQSLRNSYTEQNTVIENLQKSLNELMKQQGVEEARLSQEKDRFVKINAGICPTCHQSVSSELLSNFSNDLEKISLQINKLKEDYKKQYIEFTNGKTNLSQIQNSISQAELRNNNILHAKTTLENLQKDVEVCTSRIALNKKSLEEAESFLSTFVLDETTDVESLKAELDKLFLEKQNYENSKKEQTVWLTNITTCKNNIEIFNTKVEEVNKNINSQTSQLESLEKEVLRWQKAQYVFTEIPKLHLQKFIEDIQNICTNIVQQFGYKQIKIECTDKGIDFYLCYYPLEDVDNADIPYDMCSTFEKNLINISLIRALSSIYDIPFTCIDELDASSDEENTKKLGVLINQMVKNTPVVAVSHDPTLVDDLLQSNPTIAILKMEEK